MPKAALVILCHKPLNNRTINAIPNFQITRFKIHIFSSVISVKKLSSVGESVVYLNENHSGDLRFYSARNYRLAFHQIFSINHSSWFLVEKSTHLSKLKLKFYQLSGVVKQKDWSFMHDLGKIKIRI